MKENIELTPLEYEELKDDIKWRANTSLSLKILLKEFEEHCKTSQKFRNDVTSLKAHRAIHWFLIAGIIGSILWFKFM